MIKLAHLGLHEIKNLEAFTELQGLWLENNGLTFISGLEKQTKLCSL